mmetsp:Transcript_54018/g.105652  ORF Transcript_54018/g.105652 Transcript_54018/m.105652 type:complete len:300 (-) Transcript_54018:27-926(-)
MIEVWGRAFLWPFAPVFRRNAAIEHAIPIATVCTGHFRLCMVSKIANPAMTLPPPELMYILIGSSGLRRSISSICPTSLFARSLSMSPKSRTTRFSSKNFSTRFIATACCIATDATTGFGFSSPCNRVFVGDPERISLSVARLACANPGAFSHPNAKPSLAGTHKSSLDRRDCNALEVALSLVIPQPLRVKASENPTNVSRQQVSPTERTAYDHIFKERGRQTPNCRKVQIRAIPRFSHFSASPCRHKEYLKAENQRNKQICSRFFRRRLRVFSSIFCWKYTAIQLLAAFLDVQHGPAL